MPRERNATLTDLGQLAWAVLLFEVIVAGLAYLARGFFGSGIALWVGVGLGALVLAAFLLITGASLLVSYTAGLLQRRRCGHTLIAAGQETAMTKTDGQGGSREF